MLLEEAFSCIIRAVACFLSCINHMHVGYVLTRNVKRLFSSLKINKKSVQSRIAIFKSAII
jgi:hypothetical protein